MLSSQHQDVDEKELLFFIVAYLFKVCIGVEGPEVDLSQSL